MSKIIPIKNSAAGVWLRPCVACKYFNSGKGITERTLMNNIYAGRLNGLVRNDYTGWYVFITIDTIQAIKTEPLKVA